MCIVFLLLLAVLADCQPAGFVQSGTKQYYVAAEEIEWNYAPNVTVTSANQLYIMPGDLQFGGMYRKARYVEYTDDSFSTRKPVPTEWLHKGILGPVIRAQVGELIEVVFRNKLLRHSATMHAHQVFYDKGNEGVDVAIQPGDTITYKWFVRDSAGPGQNDGSSRMWLYHSHSNSGPEFYAGLVGFMIITRRGAPIDVLTGRPSDVDREFVSLFSVFQEEKSMYWQQNLDEYWGEPAPNSEQFRESNQKHSWNGWIFTDSVAASHLTMKVGDRVRWYVADLGEVPDVHAPHWHGQTVLQTNGMRKDSVSLLPASMMEVDMTPDFPGVWELHCHVNEHAAAGMTTQFQVTGTPPTLSTTGLVKREFYLQALEVEWDYAPNISYAPPGNVWTDGPNLWHIGKKYWKARFVATDNKWNQITRPAAEDHLGFLGPLIRAKVGEYIVVHLWNDCSQPISLTPHGLEFDPVQDTQSVKPKGTKTFTWFVPERAGPGPNDASTKLWFYHSNQDYEQDFHSGLLGPILIARAGTLVDATGKPTAIEKEFVLLFMIVNENLSYLFNDNFNRMPSASTVSPSDAAFIESNRMRSINGRMYDNVGKSLQLHQGRTSRWHVLSIGDEQDNHSPYWEGNTGVGYTSLNAMTTDTLAILPSSAAVLDMTPDHAGWFRVRCHNEPHTPSGMWTHYEVLLDPSDTDPAHLTHQTSFVVTPSTVVHRYHVAAEAVLWDYTPLTTTPAQRAQLGAEAAPYVTETTAQIGHVYTKWQYREYTNASFTTVKPQSAEWKHTGLLGPVLRARVGEVIEVVFRNRLTLPLGGSATSADVSMKAHGLLFDPPSNGAHAVRPGEERVYTWYVPERAGPLPGSPGPSSVMWLYHSGIASDQADMHAGLVGAILISARDTPVTPQGRPVGVDREFVTLFYNLDENTSPLLAANMKRHADTVWDSDLIPGDPAFIESNTKRSINGYLYGNIAVHDFTMFLGETVRWYVAGLGGEEDLHTPHWHAMSVRLAEQRETDVIDVLPATMLTVDMRPDAVGTWMYHCHVTAHMNKGMNMFFRVVDPSHLPPDELSSTGEGGEEPSFLSSHFTESVVGAIVVTFFLVPLLCYFLRHPIRRCSQRCCGACAQRGKTTAAARKPRYVTAPGDTKHKALTEDDGAAPPRMSQQEELTMRKLAWTKWFGKQPPQDDSTLAGTSADDVDSSASEHAHELETGQSHKYAAALTNGNGNDNGNGHAKPHARAKPGGVSGVSLLHSATVRSEIEADLNQVETNLQQQRLHSSSAASDSASSAPGVSPFAISQQLHTPQDDDELDTPMSDVDMGASGSSAFALHDLAVRSNPSHSSTQQSSSSSRWKLFSKQRSSGAPAQASPPRKGKSRPNSDNPILNHILGDVSDSEGPSELDEDYTQDFDTVLTHKSHGRHARKESENRSDLP